MYSEILHPITSVFGVWPLSARAYARSSAILRLKASAAFHSRSACGSRCSHWLWSRKTGLKRRRRRGSASSSSKGARDICLRLRVALVGVSGSFVPCDVACERLRRGVEGPAIGVDGVSEGAKWAAANCVSGSDSSSSPSCRRCGADSGGAAIFGKKARLAGEARPARPVLCGVVTALDFSGEETFCLFEGVCSTSMPSDSSDSAKTTFRLRVGVLVGDASTSVPLRADLDGDLVGDVPFTGVGADERPLLAVTCFASSDTLCLIFCNTS